MDQAERALKTARIIDLVVEHPDEQFESFLDRCQLASVLPFFRDIRTQEPAPKYTRFFVVDFGLNLWDYHRAKEHRPELDRRVPGIRPGYVRELLILARQCPDTFTMGRTMVAHGSITDPYTPDFEVAAIKRSPEGFHLGLSDGGAKHGGYSTLLYTLPLEKQP